MSMTTFKVVQADIATLQVDAVVNAANTALARGSGVCGAIFRGAGPELEGACEKLGGCETGDAKITKGYNLPAKFVIHTVGPVWMGGGDGEQELLASCYRRSLELAAGHGLVSIAFPAISTGVYRFPFEVAAGIAVKIVRESVKTETSLREVIYCCFSEKDCEIYEQLLRENH